MCPPCYYQNDLVATQVLVRMIHAALFQVSIIYIYIFIYIERDR